MSEWVSGLAGCAVAPLGYNGARSWLDGTGGNMEQRWVGVAAAAASLMAVAACGLFPSGATPRAASDLQTVCANGRGFGGLPAYVSGKGKPHMGVLLKNDGTSWQPSSIPDFTSEWLLTEDAAPDDVDTVICEERVSATPGHTTCSLHDYGTAKDIKFTLYATEYRIRVREARTGKTLLEQVVKASSTDCPVMLSGADAREIETGKQFILPTDAQIRAAVQPIMVP